MPRLFKTYSVLTVLILFSLGVIYFCSRTPQKPPPAKAAKKPIIKKVDTVSQVNYYIENSAGNFGYVSGALNNYIEVVSELTQKSEFATDSSISQEFNFINGIDDLVITPQGNDPGDFASNKLNVRAYKVGDFSGNDLNAMFQYVLSKAGKDSISIMITDAIYDIGKKENPLTALRIQSKETTNRFIERLNEEEMQTLIVKFSSNFNGTYYYGSQPGKININQNRPFYVFIFGSPELLNRYFDDQYIKSLDGYKNQARLFVPDDESISYMVTQYKKIGDFYLPKDHPHKLTNVESDSRRGGKFQFTFAVNYSALNLTESYLRDTTSYEANNKFKVVSVDPFPSDKIFGAAKINPTHIITVSTKSFPAGNLEVHLKNRVPGWFDETNIIDDSNIKGNTHQTFGFKYLINGITDAYLNASNKDDLATFSITLEQ